MSETSMNPNVPVGSEGTAPSKANSAVTFDDITGLDEGKAKPKAKAKEEKPKAEPKKEKTAKAGTGFDDIPDDAEDEEDEPAPKKDTKTDDRTVDPKAPKDKEKPEDKPKGKPKAAKFKAGDQEFAVPADAVIAIPVDGKPVEFTMAELQSEISGKTNWTQKNQELHKDKTSFEQTRTNMNSLIDNVLKKAQEDPEELVDFLADLTKQDPVAIKAATLRKQYEAMLPVFELDEREREAWFKDQERNWRDRAHDRRTRVDTENQAKQVSEAKRAEVTQKYSIEDQEYSAAEKVAKDFLKFQDPDYKDTPTPEQVVYAARHMAALHTIERVVPHLAEHKRFDDIVGDIVQDLVKNPGMSQEKLAAILRDTWPKPEGDDKGLRDLGRKAAKHAQISDDPPPRRQSNREPTFFDDVE